MEKLAARPVEAAVEFLRKLSKSETPAVAVVLGSGVKVLEDLEDIQTVTFQEVFGISPGVIGHSGAITLGRLNGKLVAVLRGRFHLYEGHNWDVVTLPSRVIAEWGVPHVFLTNAAGGLNSNFNVGDLMLITSYRDHLHPRFTESGLLPALRQPSVSCTNSLTEHVLNAARKLSLESPLFRPMQVGCYAGLLGPNYETLAEIEMLKAVGADAVGMSTVPELESCKGTKTLPVAISVITNVWKPEELVGGHEEVLHAAKEASERLDLLFKALIV
jgi:purine-nucleoside phosphorylase